MSFAGSALRIAAGVLLVAGVYRLVSLVPVDHIVVSKSARTLVAYAADGTELARLPIVIGKSPLGTKHREGDRRTPEGEYRVCFKNSKSRFHLSLGLNYPNAADARRGLAEGRIRPEDYVAIVQAERDREIPPWKTPLGGEIFIHGERQSRDFTAGCVAVDNDAMTDLFARTALGTRVTIEP